jgi:hypothetical protein
MFLQAGNALELYAMDGLMYHNKLGQRFCRVQHSSIAASAITPSMSSHAFAWPALNLYLRHFCSVVWGQR